MKVKDRKIDKEKKKIKSFDLASEYVEPSYLKSFIASNTRCMSDKLVKSVQELVIHNSLVGRRPPKDKHITLMKGLYSGTERFQNFLVEMSDKLAAEYPVSTNNSRGFIEAPFVPKSFHNLRTLAGYGMDPKGVPNPLKFVENRGSSDALDKYLVKILGTLLFKAEEHSSLMINRLSNSGFPYFTFDAATKVGSIRKILEDHERFVDLLAEHKYDSLFERYQFAPVVTKTERSQVDTISMDNNLFIPKERRVTDFFGVEMAANKTIEGISHKLFRTRTREAFSYPILLNAAFQPIMQSARNYYSATYNFTYKHRSGEDVAQKLQQYDRIIGVDVTQFDQTIPLELMEIAINASNFPEATKVAIINTLSIPFIYENDHMGERGSLLLNVRGHEMGLASGIFCVPDIGKVMGTKITLKIFVQSRAMNLTYNFTEDCAIVDNVLRGNNPICGTLNAGDDAIIGVNGNNELFDRIESIIDVTPRLKVESPISFLGDTFAVTGVNEVVAYPSINSYAENWWVPEHSYLSRHRFYAPFGWFDRKEHFGKHPLFLDVEKIINSLYKKHFHSNVDDNAQIDGMKMASPPKYRNMVEKLFMLKPALIHYRYDAKDISKDVLDAYFINFEKSYLDKHIKLI